MLFSAEEWLRYQRHIQLPQFSVAGQQSLKQSRVLVVGAGGLGCPVSQYLAAAGVGHITLVDADRVNLSNLQRQILFTTEDVGRPKVEVARQRLLAINNTISIQAINAHLSLDNALALIEACDLVVDCSDNFNTRYLINDICAAVSKPWIYGSVLGFSGQLALFSPGECCFRCLFPEASDVADCNQSGVLGVMPGLIGLLQATEVIKFLAQLPGSLRGRLLLVEGLNSEMRSIKLSQSPDCIICSGKHTYRDCAEDYQFLCAAEEISADYVLSPSQFKNVQQDNSYRLIDVRSEAEHQAFNLGGECLTVDSIVEDRHAMDVDGRYLFYCQSGQRSTRAADHLRAAGFNGVFSLQGGMAGLLAL